MSESQLPNGASCDGSRDRQNAAVGKRSFWRYLCGFFFGVAVGGLLVLCTIPFVGDLLMSYMEYGPDDLLQDVPVVFGLTIPDLLGVTWISLIFVMPLAGVIVQHKPMFGKLNSWQASIAAFVCALFSLGLVVYCVGQNVFYWAYLYI